MEDVSNCYLVKPSSGSIAIPYFAVSGGTSTSTSDPFVPVEATIPEGATCGLLWTDNSNGLSSSGVVSSVSISGNNLLVTTGSAEGNAVVYLKNSRGTILWSWHIWVTDYDPDDGGKTYPYSTTGTTFMDRNLGATAVATAINSPLASYGLYYQWGRKDPFPSANATTINNVSGVTGSAAMYGTETKVTIDTQDKSVDMATATENPTTFYTGNSSPYDWNSSPNVNLWGNSTTSIVNSKSPYDPCPVGWRVPVYKSGVSPWNGLSGSWSTWSSKVGYPPASGYRGCGNGEFLNVGSSGDCWAAAPGGNYGCGLHFDSSSVDSSGRYYRARANGFGVRCCRE